MSAREATLADIYGEGIPVSELHFKPTGRHGKKHPQQDIDSIYVDLHSRHGTLSGYVEPELFSLLERMLRGVSS